MPQTRSCSTCCSQPGGASGGDEMAWPARCLLSTGSPALSGWIPSVPVPGRRESKAGWVKGSGTDFELRFMAEQPFCSTQTSRSSAEGHCSIKGGMPPKCVITVARYPAEDERSGSVAPALNGSPHFHFISRSRTHTALFPCFFPQLLMPESCVTFPRQV